MKSPQYTTIDEYIASFPDPVQKKLNEIRNLIKKEVPEAIEKISYHMPAFSLHGTLVYFAAYPNHIGLYPTPSGMDASLKDLLKYRH